MCNLFSSISSNLANKITTSISSYFADYMTNINQPNSFFYRPATSEEIENEILLLPNNKAYDLYSIPIILLKSARSVIGIHLAKIIYQCKLVSIRINLRLQRLSLFLKMLQIEVTITLLSVFNRIFERDMYNRLIEFIDKHIILSNALYSFRKCHSTHHAVLDIIDQIHSSIDNKLYICAIFWTLKKRLTP